MRGLYERSAIKTYTYDPDGISSEVKSIIEKKEKEGASLKEVCKLLNRNDREIYRILKRRYKIHLVRSGGDKYAE